MSNKIFVGIALAFCAAGAASAQSTTASAVDQSVAVSSQVLAAVATCENQMHRLAGLNKGLAANYNAARVHNECLARASTTTDIASK
jgi:hypothetical protein